MQSDSMEPQDDVPSVIPVGDRLRPRPGFGGAVLWCLAFVAVLIATFLVGFLIDFAVQYSTAEDPEAFLDAIQLDPDNPKLSPELASGFRWGMLAAELGTVLFAWFILRFKLGRDWRRKIALTAPTWEHLAIAIMIVPGFMLMSGLVGSMFQSIFHSPDQKPALNLEEMLGEILGPWPAWLSVLVIGVGPGIGEELWCRGFLGRGLIGRYGFIGGILATSLLFGAMHGPDPAYILTTVFMGAMLHLMYLATRSLWISIFVHFANNSIATLLSLGYVQLRFLDPSVDIPPIPILASGAALFIACAFAFYRGHARLVDTDQSGPVWRPLFPGVELPPAESCTRIERPSVMGLPMGLVILSFGAFILSCVVLG